MGKVRRLSRVIDRGSWIFAAKLLLSLVAIVFAAAIQVTSSTYQAEMGSVVKFPTGLLATDKGFSAASTAISPKGTSCSNPAQFTLNTTANTNIVVGDFAYDVQVNATASAPANTPFNVTLVLGSNSFGPLCIKTLAVLSGTIDCKFDILSATLPASPYTFKVTIQ